MNTPSATDAEAIARLVRTRQGDIDSAEWDLLFRAVVARLRQLLTRSPQIDAKQGSVEDCLLALETLHAMLDQERGRAARVEREAALAHAALEATGAELSSSRASERRARHLAAHDPLTTLPNRHQFDARLAEALSPSDCRPALAVLYLDLDGFKPINDRHGHAVGDELLRIVARRLAGTVRAGDLVCRIGGDEFACVVADPPAREQLSHLACALFAAVSAPAKIGPLDLSVRPSIGIARCPVDGDTAATLLMHADAAMFRAKRRQLGHAFFDRRSDT